jgi:hypothetical protein
MMLAEHQDLLATLTSQYVHAAVYYFTHIKQNVNYISSIQQADANNCKLTCIKKLYKEHKNSKHC